MTNEKRLEALAELQAECKMLTLEDRKAFLNLPIEERRKILEQGSEQLAKYYTNENKKETETLDQTACKAIDPATITWTDRVMEKVKNPYETLEDWLEANHPDWRLLLPEQLVDLIIKEY